MDRLRRRIEALEGQGAQSELSEGKEFMVRLLFRLTDVERQELYRLASRVNETGSVHALTDAEIDCLKRPASKAE